MKYVHTESPAYLGMLLYSASLASSNFNQLGIDGTGKMADESMVAAASVSLALVVNLSSKT